MRPAPRLALLAITALAALLLSAATASADVPVEVHDESGNHCDPCEVHVVGESLFHVTGVPSFVVTQCEDEFVAELYEDGTGHITDLTNVGHNSQPCVTAQCNGVGESESEIEWEFDLEEVAPNETELSTVLCLDSRADPDAAGNHCAVDILLEETDTHTYELQASQPCPSGLTFEGTWTIEGSPIEIEHPDDPPPPDPIEVHETGAHCDPCEIHLTGESQIAVSPIGVISACEDELTAEIYEDGTGHITDLTSQDHATISCITQNCNGVGEAAGETEWPTQIEESGPSSEEVPFRLCLDSKANPNGTAFHCDVAAELVSGGNHEYEIVLDDESCNGSLLVSAQWEVEGTPIEVEHSGETVEIHDEGATQTIHCDPCEVHLTGESQIVVPPLGAVSACEDELTVEIYEDGTGHITDLTSQDHATISCITQNCNGVGEAAGEAEWPTQIGESGPSSEGLAFTLCYDNRTGPNGAGFHCEIDAELLDQGSHQYEIVLDDEPCDSTLLLSAQWEIEGAPIEIEHPGG
jgi:hypothetical protein